MRERAWKKRKKKRRRKKRRGRGEKKRKEKRSMMEILPASCSIFSTSVLCPKGGLFFPRPPFFILLSICSFILESLSAPSDPLFIVPVLRSYVKAPLFNLTSLILFLLPPSSFSFFSFFVFSLLFLFFPPPFSHNRLRKGTQPSGKRSATRRGISFFSFDSWWYLCRRLKEKRSHARNNGVSMTNIIIVGNYYRVNLFDGTVRSFRYPDDSFFLPLLS